jgi:cytoskeletal protein RodZ
VPIALAAVPVVLNLRHSLKPEFGIPELALRLRAWSAVLHVVAGVLIILTAIVEIWLDLYAAGPWLFAVYGAAASIAVLAVVAFYLSRIAEKPPAEPKASENETAENDTAGDDTAEHDTAGDDTAGNEKTPPAKRMKRRLGKRSRKVSETTAVEETTEAPAEVSEEEPAPVQVSITDTAEAEIPVVEDDITGADSGADNSGVADADGADPPAAAPSDEETPPAAGLRNKRPTGKSRHRLPR